MITLAQLETFSQAVARRIAGQVAKSDPVAPRAFCGKVGRDGIAIASEDALSGPGCAAPESILKIVASLLAEGAEIVAVAHEAWVTRIPGLGEEAFRQAMGHLAWRPDGRAEAVICALHAAEFQTAIVHGVERRGGARRLIVGPSMFDSLRIGGAMSRPMPVRH